MPNYWVYASLIDCRSAAVRYLKSIQKDFGEKSAAHLSKTSDLYKQEVDKLRAGAVNILGPCDEKKWTPEMRRAEAAMLKECLELEKQAIAEIKAAIEADSSK
jgi:hypothetical protein